MKKLLFSGMFLTSLIASGVNLNAQDVAFNRTKVVAVNPYPETSKKIVSEVDVNVNAVRDFKTNFKQATDVKWTKQENGASVFFTNDGMKMRTTYNGRGRKEYTLKYYDESRMPANLRHQVKSNYYDHNIAVVTEVITNRNIYYLVKMENQKEYLTLRVVEGEISIFEKIDKRK